MRRRYCGSKRDHQGHFRESMVDGQDEFCPGKGPPLAPSAKEGPRA